MSETDNTDEKPLLNGVLTGKDPKTGQFVEGNKNGLGRPKGSFSLTTKMIRRLEENPEETKAILDWFLKNRKDMIWNKIDPNPAASLNLNAEVRIGKPLLHALHDNDSSREDRQIEEEN
jgi:hypothetical protein